MSTPSSARLGEQDSRATAAAAVPVAMAVRMVAVSVSRVWRGGETGQAGVGQPGYSMV